MKGGRKTDLTSVLGVPIGIGCILLGQMLEGGTIQSILQLTAAIIVFGGTLGAVLLSFTLVEVRRAWFALRDVFWDEPRSADDTIATIGRLATKARRDGIMSLEDDVEQLNDPFMKRGFMLAVDGTNPSTLRAMLDAESGTQEDVEESPAKVYEAAGGYAPTVGIIGAVLGLIQVMQNLSDIEKVGHGIASAFVATIYGVAIANLIALPCGGKMKTRTRDEVATLTLILEGALGIQQGVNPMVLRERLEGLMPHDEKHAAGKEGAGAGAAARSATA